MNTDIFNTVCEAKAIRQSELSLGRKEPVQMGMPVFSALGHILTDTLTAVLSLVF